MGCLVGSRDETTGDRDAYDGSCAGKLSRGECPGRVARGGLLEGSGPHVQQRAPSPETDYPSALDIAILLMALLQLHRQCLVAGLRRGALWNIAAIRWKSRDGCFES